MSGDHGEEYPEYARRCQKCGAEAITGRVTAREEQFILEMEFHCATCGEPVAYWAYGHYDPAYDPDHKPTKPKAV